jgi:TIR domain
MRKVFFSYASEDRPRLARYASAFEEFKIEILIDYEQIVAGHSIPDRINEMIKCSDAAVLFYSEAYARKPWTTEEQNALQFRTVEHMDYQIIVVRLDPVELPPLLAHRIWMKEGDVRALASVFVPDLRAAPSHLVVGADVNDWIQMFPDNELERMALVIQATLRQQPSASMVPWRSKKAGAVTIHLYQPLVSRLADSLASVLRMLEKSEFIRQRLREKIAVGGLGIFEGPFMLAEQERFRQIEDFQIELRETLEALVERVTLA